MVTQAFDNRKHGARVKQMRRQEREKFAERNRSRGFGRENGRDNDQANTRVGVEAFVAKENSSARPKWDTDETLGAYIAKG